MLRLLTCRRPFSVRQSTYQNEVTEAARTGKFKAKLKNPIFSVDHFSGQFGGMLSRSVYFAKQCCLKWT